MKVTKKVQINIQLNPEEVTMLKTVLGKWTDPQLEKYGKGYVSFVGNLYNELCHLEEITKS